MKRIIGLSLCIIFILSGFDAFAQTALKGKMIYWSNVLNFPPDPIKGSITDILYIMNADGSNATELFEENIQDGDKVFGGFMSHPVSLSPDCKKVAFTMETYNFVPNNAWDLLACDIAFFDIDSGKIENLTKGKIKWCSFARWSPDGSKIVFHDVSLPDKIYVINSDGTNMKVIGEGICPDWSYNGRKIAFVRRDPNGNYEGIYTMNSDGSNVNKIMKIDAGFCVFHLRWSPDSMQILFSTFIPNKTKDVTYIMDSDGKNLKLLRDPSYNCCWSPDGKSIAFTGVIEPDDRGHIWIIGVDGSNLTKLTNAKRGESIEDWRDPNFVAVDKSSKSVTTTWGKIKN
jgi:Tol biopolymer transport system component